MNRILALDPLDFYGILGVDDSATSPQIRTAYRQRSVLIHPDRFINATAEDMDMINAAFNRLGDAYEVLSDDELRQEFDEMAETARMTGVDLAAMFNAFLQRYRQRQANRQQRQADEDAGPSSAYRAAYRAVQASLYTAKVRPAHRPM